MVESRIERELARERAAALARIGRRLERAVERVRAAERELEARPPERRAAAKRRLRAAREEAGRWLWCYLVQREACGLRHHGAVERLCPVPPRPPVGGRPTGEASGRGRGST